MTGKTGYGSGVNQSKSATLFCVQICIKMLGRLLLNFITLFVVLGSGQDPADWEHAGQGGRDDHRGRDGLHLQEGARQHAGTYAHKPLLRSVVTTLSLCVYFGTHFFVISCHFCSARRPDVSTFGKVRGRLRYFIFFISWNRCSPCRYLQIVATRITPPCRRTCAVFKNKQWTGSALALNSPVPSSVSVYIEKMENTTFIASFVLGFKNVCSYLVWIEIKF